jgi:hypothetical protein
VRDNEGARVIQVLANGPVHLIKLPRVSQPELKDHRAHAADEVGQDRAAGITGLVEVGSRLDADVLQARLPVQLGQAAADGPVGSVSGDGGAEDLAQPVPGRMSGVAR